MGAVAENDPGIEKQWDFSDELGSGLPVGVFDLPGESYMKAPGTKSRQVPSLPLLIRHLVTIDQGQVGVLL
jgi:hypothetical protein